MSTPKEKYHLRDCLRSADQEDQKGRDGEQQHHQRDEERVAVGHRGDEVVERDGRDLKLQALAVSDV